MLAGISSWVDEAKTHPDSIFVIAVITTAVIFPIDCCLASGYVQIEQG